MLTIISNTPQSNTFAPWEITKDSITKGKISLPYKDLGLKIGDVAQTTQGNLVSLSTEKLFLDFDRTNLSPSLTKSTSDKSYFVLLVTEALKPGEKVVYVRSEKGYLLEWNYNLLSGQFDAILAFRASHQETSVSVYIANEKGQVREIKFYRSPERDSVGVKHNNYQERPEIRTDKKLSILPYRPYKPTKHIIAHRTQLAKAKDVFGEKNGYEFHEYLHLKSARALVASLKQQGVTAVTIFYNEEGLLALTDDQRFFSRAIAESFEFVNISYKGVSLQRYYFSGKTTLPKRKQPARRGAKKPAPKKPGVKNKNIKPAVAKKPGASQKIKASSYYGAAGNKPIKK